MLSGVTSGSHFPAGFYAGIYDDYNDYDAIDDGNDDDNDDHDGMLSGVTTSCHFPTHCRLLLGFQHQALLSG